jgi:hypothetical protein
MVFERKVQRRIFWSYERCRRIAGGGEESDTLRSVVIFAFHGMSLG